MHTQALYWSCIELIKDVYLNHGRKAPNALWTIMCTHFINYNCFNLSKVFIKIRIQCWYIHSSCLFVLLLDSSCTCTSGFFLYTIVSFSSTESVTEYLIAPVVWVTITLYCQYRTVAPFHSFKFTLRDFHHAPLTLLSGEVWVHTLITQECCWVIIITYKCTIV